MNTVIKMNTIPESQIQIEGMNVLKEHLGVVNTIRFLEQFDNGGTGDYTKEKYNLDIMYYECEVDWEKSEFDIPSKNEFEKIFRLIFLDENKKHDKNTSLFVVITIDLTPVKHKYVVYENIIPDLKKLIKDIRKKHIKEK